MTLTELARKLRAHIEKAAQSLDDTEALDAVSLYPAWSGEGVPYTSGQRVRDGGILYRVLQDHTSQAGWEPDVAPSLFAKVLIPTDEQGQQTSIPPWEQPDSTNPYMMGNQTTHNGKTWESEVDNNVWEPGVYGWKEVQP